jgi:leader peptidase (prepilin peptidase)/N-methyltransferase
VYGGVWLLTGGRGMGLGDVALAPVLGLALGWLGWGPSLVGLLGGFVVGAVVGVVLMLGRRAGRRSRVPHGPFMLAGAGLGMFWGQPVWEAYLRLVGIA